MTRALDLNSSNHSAAPAASAARGFAHVDTWIFDLDNTLYPAACNLFAQVDHRMGEFVQKFLGVPYPYARHLQKAYYRQFGTTLSGMMQVHSMDPRQFLDYVHDIDLSGVPGAPELDQAIAQLPGRKLIFTNGTRRHAERVAAKLGILGRFDDIFDIVDSDYIPKPHRAPYDKFLADHAIAPQSAAMFEDMPQNLEAPHDLGMTTVLVRSTADYDNIVQRKIRAWTQVPDHVHHMTDDLAEFVGRLGADRRA
jgi:putative hydrolase of the HAD superfamily